jgi:hypothetical protein
VAVNGSIDERLDIELIDDMGRSGSLLADDDVGDKSNDGGRGANESITVGSSSCESFRYSGHGYANGDSRVN